MRTPNEIYDDVHEQIRTEMRATADFRRTLANEFARAMVGARADLLPLLREAAGLRDIDLLLDIERDFMALELDHIAHDEKHIASLNRGIRQVDAAVAMLERARDPDRYREIGFCYTLSEDLIHPLNLPKDAVHKFFGSHRTRFGNKRSVGLDESQTDLLDARSDNMGLARKIYVELQRQALAAPEVRESTLEIREPAKPYMPERKLRLAA